MEQFYCPHTLADGNYHIQISEATVEFSSTPYPYYCNNTVYKYNEKVLISHRLTKRANIVKKYT